MKKISIWAKTNAVYARLIIVIIHFMLTFLGIHTGLLLVKMNFNINASAFYAGLLIYISVFFVYPGSNNIWRIKLKRKVYMVQKSCDIVLAFGGFLMISIFSKNFYATSPDKIHFPLVSQISASKGANSTAEEILQSLKYRSAKELTHAEKKVLKHEFVKQAKVYVKAKAKQDYTTAEKAFLIIITIAVAVGLAFLVGALACGIACGGAEGLAIIVVLAGLAGVIFGSIVLIRAILKISNKKRQTTVAQ